MADINCAHCAEPWDVYGLRTDSIGYLDSDQTDMLAPLGPVEDVLAFLARHGGESDRTLSTALLDAAVREMTLAALFEWWWNSDPDDESCARTAAKRVVDTAIYLGVLGQRGCPACGWDHAGPGEHAEQTREQIAFGSVTDLDPMLFLGGHLS